MTDLHREFAQLLDDATPPDVWVDPDQIRQRVSVQRRAGWIVASITAVFLALLLIAVGPDLLPNASPPQPATPQGTVQAGPIACSYPGGKKKVHLAKYPCPDDFGPGRYLEIVMGFRANGLYSVSLPEGWRFGRQAPLALGSQSDLVTDDGDLGIRITRFVEPAGTSRSGTNTAPPPTRWVKLLGRVNGITVSSPQRTTLGGQRVLVVDITANPDSPAPNSVCADDVPCFPLLEPAGATHSAAAAVGAIPAATSRLYLFHHLATSLVPSIVWVWTTHPSADFSAQLARADPVLDSLTFLGLSQ
jgi:hypothetical protein